MIEFLNAQVREEFHLLPLERQRSILESAERLAKFGQVIKVLYVDRINETQSELSIRIDQKFNLTASKT